MAMEMIAVAGSLKTSLENRIKAAKSPSSNIKWTTGKISWLKFTSNVVRTVDKSTSPFQSLGGGSFGSDMYDKSSRSVPLPGVMSATIKHTGTLKTLKKTEVSYKCWSISHLQELEKLFMSLGKTVVLEYGWSVMPSGTSVTSTLTEDQFKLSFGDFLVDVDKLVEINEGCYGAEKGTVSNFSWSANDDGSYDCSTSFISPSEMMMSQDAQKMDKSGKCCLSSDGNPVKIDDATAKCKKDSDITIKLKHIMASQVLKTDQAAINDNYKYWGFAMRMDKEMSPAEQADSSWPRNWLSNSIMTDQKFVTWAYFEENIINDALMTKAVGAVTGDNGGDSNDNAPGSFREPNLTAVTRLDCRMTKLHNPAKTTSSDPTVCILPDQMFWNIEGVDETGYDKINTVNDFKSMAGLKLMAPFKVWNAPGQDYDPDTMDNLGWLSHICINVRFLITCADESATLEELINKVLDGINISCGNPWDFVITPLPNNALLATIVDVKALGKFIDPFPISISGNNTIVRTAKLDTEVSNEIKAQIMYGSNAEQPKETTAENPTGDAPTSEFNLFGLGLSDRTVGWNNQTTNLLEPCEKVGDAKGGKEPDDPVGERKQLVESWRDAWIDLTSGVDDSTISTMKSTVKALQLYSKYEDLAQTAPPILPLNLSLTLDGIHGFKWGHSITAKPLPTRYSDCTFMVTGVDHNITTDSWETSISTVLRIPPMPAAKRVLRKELVKKMSSYQAQGLGLGVTGGIRN